MILRKAPAEIERIAVAGALVAETISHVGEHLEPDMVEPELVQRLREGVERVERRVKARE